MTRIAICMGTLALIATGVPASAQVIEKEVIIRDDWAPGGYWRRVWDPEWRAECQVIRERRVRPDGTTVIRRIRRCY